MSICFMHCKTETISPAGTKYPAGTLFDEVTRNKKRQDTLPFFTRRKRREFDVFKPHKYTVSCGDPVMVLCRF